MLRTCCALYNMLQGMGLSPPGACLQRAGRHRGQGGHTLATNPISDAHGREPRTPGRVHMGGSCGVLWLWGSHRQAALYVRSGWSLESCQL